PAASGGRIRERPDRPRRRTPVSGGNRGTAPPPRPVRPALGAFVHFRQETAERRRIMAKPAKVQAVEEIKSNFQNSTSAVVTEYRGLSVPQVSELRNALGDSATYTVAKNTLVKRAAQEAGVEGLDDLLNGPTAIVRWFVQERRSRVPRRPALEDGWSPQGQPDQGRRPVQRARLAAGAPVRGVPGHEELAHPPCFRVAPRRRDRQKGLCHGEAQQRRAP